MVSRPIRTLGTTQRCDCFARRRVLVARRPARRHAVDVRASPEPAQPEAGAKQDEEDAEAFPGASRQAENWLQGLRNGMTEDELAAQALGKASLDDLTELEEGYVERIKESMRSRVDKLLEKDVAARQLIESGKKLFEFGRYSKAIGVFERAKALTTFDTLVGADVQIWLALCYDSSGRGQEARQILRYLMEGHPLSKVGCVRCAPPPNACALAHGTR